METHPDDYVDNTGARPSDEEDPLSITEVYRRALHCFGGNHEAASMYPGDFV